jgi:hypothetical protein
MLGIRLRYLVPVREPLVLISQVQRSGGTLLSQLFDGHSQCHAHPDELKIGFPRKENWPELDLAGTPESWFRMLREVRPKTLKGGYRKQSKGLLADLGPEAEPERHPFIFSTSLQQRIFEADLEGREVTSERHVLDAYMTSYFNAWLDNHNLYTGPKRIVTGFTPRIAMDPGNVARFFSVYPDGKLIAMIRDPASWYVSARKHDSRRYGSLPQSVGLWTRSAEAAVEAFERHGAARVFVLGFEDLVRDTGDTMRRLAAWLGIDFEPALENPTFNHLAIKADSSYRVADYGVIREPLDRAGELSREESRQIREQTHEAYDRALAVKM